VRASTPVYTANIGLPDEQDATLLAVDTAGAASVAPFGLGGVPDGVLRRLAPSGQPAGVQIPGRPARLAIVAGLGSAAIGQPVLSIDLTDAAGISYLMPAGQLPADGRAHRLVVTIATVSHADYPLRVTGFTLQFALPVAATPSDTLTIDSFSAATALGPFGAPFAAAAPGRPLTSTPESDIGSGITSPAVSRVLVGPAGQVSAVFKTGLNPPANFGYTPGTPGSIALAAGPTVTTLPAVATGAFLAATGLKVGGTAAATVGNLQLSLHVIAEATALPTLSGIGGVLVDQQELQSAVAAGGQPPLPVTQWWLRTSGARVDLPALPAGTSVATRASLAQSLLDAPLSAAPQQALLAIALAAVLLACAGFLISVATARERARDVALLDALGARPGQVARLLCAEQAMLAIPAAAAGLLLGFVLGRLLIPAISLTPAATRPVPPVVVEVPWALVAAIAVAVGAAPVVAALLAMPRTAATAARLRVEEQI
jgi:hypothetical protein